MAVFRQRSAAEIIQGVVESSKVVSAFQTVPASYLSNIDATLNIDVLIAGDDELSLAKVSNLIRDIPNLRPLKVGPLENSKFIEAITPLLLNVAVLNGLQDPTIRVVPWIPKLD
jgi:predicted dinucleotide-binding enzyme